MDQWYYASGEERVGPIGIAELLEMLRSGRLTPDTLVWRAGMADWQPVRAVPELNSAANVAGSALPPPGMYAHPTLQYQTPTARPPSSDDDLTGFDWVICILCSGIGCIIGIIRCVQGKKSGPKMLGISILFMIIWGVLRGFLTALSQH